MNNHMPGKTARTLAFILSLLLTLTLFLTALSTQAVRLLTDDQLHRQIATADAVTDAQMERINSAIDTLAAQQSFAPETLKTLITREAVEDYAIQCVSWWMGLMQPDPVMTAPFWDDQALQNAVRKDELFQQSVKSALRRTVARDDVAYPVAKTIQETVLPIRAQLISFVLPTVLEKVNVPALMQYVSIAPQALGCTALVLALLVLLTLRRSMSMGSMYIGSSAAAAALLTLGMLATVCLLNPAALAAQANALLAMQLSLLLNALALPLLIAGVIALLLGLMLIAVHQRCVRRTIVRSIAS